MPGSYDTVAGFPFNVNVVCGIRRRSPACSSGYQNCLADQREARREALTLSRRR
jgi:hypothetical protein